MIWKDHIRVLSESDQLFLCYLLEELCHGTQNEADNHVLSTALLNG